MWVRILINHSSLNLLDYVFFLLVLIKEGKVFSQEKFKNLLTDSLWNKSSDDYQVSDILYNNF